MELNLQIFKGENGHIILHEPVMEPDEVFEMLVAGEFDVVKYD